jgi:hypothetical protein
MRPTAYLLHERQKCSFPFFLPEQRGQKIATILLLFVLKGCTDSTSLNDIISLHELHLIFFAIVNSKAFCAIITSLSMIQLDGGYILIQ